MTGPFISQDSVSEWHKPQIELNLVDSFPVMLSIDFLVVICLKFKQDVDKDFRDVRQFKHKCIIKSFITVKTIRYAK